MSNLQAYVRTSSAPFLYQQLKLEALGIILAGNLEPARKPWELAGDKQSLWDNI